MRTVTIHNLTFLDDLGATSVFPIERCENTWSLDGSALVFKMIRDECNERKIDLTNSTWTKQP